MPPRSKRKTIITAALATDAGKALSLPVSLRVLDAASAEVVPVAEKERPPELVIG